MAQPKPVLPAQPRLRSLEWLEDEIVKAETDRGRWAVQAESPSAAIGVAMAEARIVKSLFPRFTLCQCSLAIALSAMRE